VTTFHLRSVDEYACSNCFYGPISTPSLRQRRELIERARGISLSTRSGEYPAVSGDVHAVNELGVVLDVYDQCKTEQGRTLKPYRWEDVRYHHLLQDSEPSMAAPHEDGFCTLSPGDWLLLQDGGILELGAPDGKGFSIRLSGGTKKKTFLAKDASSVIDWLPSV
jgi:hypothetical protein